MSESTSSSREGLHFFGSVSASVSHEIKNVFAVINEGAGLIEDFTLMAQKGMPIEPERLKRVARSILGQIQRGDGIVKNMNAFAHLTDQDISEIELEEILRLTVALARRMADMKQMGLEMGECEPAIVQTNPFDLMRLLHGAIAVALGCMSKDNVLSVKVQPEMDGAMFTLAAPGQALAWTADDDLLNLAQQMQITVTSNKDGTLELHLK